jgi:hypothetical protein
MSADTLQQANMFTGAWETKRTPRSRPEQTMMFSINETFVFGERPRPWLAKVAAPTLELIREDVRTPEEVERDLRRAAEALITPMFASEALPESGDTPEQPEPDHENDPPPLSSAATEKATPLSCYHALVNLAHEQAVTLWVDASYRGRFYAQLPEAILTAQGAGLTSAEISAAMQIGEFQGKREREAAAHVPGVMADTSHPNPVPIPPQPTLRESTTPQVGFRARLRYEQRPVRTRHAPPKVPEIVPGLWMEREHIRKRLPYLAEGISRMDEDELNSLAESISEALQASYWSILGIALAHYVDHEQRERMV